MVNERNKKLGLEARAWRLSCKDNGVWPPSADLMHAWFVWRAGPVRKCDVQEFDAWMRSENGFHPHPKKNGMQHALAGDAHRWSSPDDPCQYFTLEPKARLIYLTVNGLAWLAGHSGRLPSK